MIQKLNLNFLQNYYPIASLVYIIEYEFKHFRIYFSNIQSNKI